MVDSIKITALQNIGANIAYTTLVPLVNMAGTPTTQKANLQILGNLILNGAGGSYFARAAQANIALSVANAAQPNITSVGTLTTLAVTGNITAGNISGGNIVVANFYYGDGGFLTNVVANGSYSNSNVAAYLPTYTGNVGAGNVNVTGTVYANGLSSTGLASLTTLNVSTTANLGAVSNITITGGSAGQKLTTNGNGVLSWTNDANSSYGDSNVVSLLSAFGSNTITTTGNISGGNLVTGGQVVASGNVSSGTGLTTGGFLSVDGTADLHNTTVTGYANVTGTANTVGGGATVGVRSILAIDSAFGSNSSADPASAQAVRGRVTGNNLTKTRNYVAGVTGQYLVTGTNASEFINTGLLGVVGDQTTTANAAVVAYLDGDGGLTTAGSAYGVSMKNSTPGSGFDYGLDLQFINLNVAGTTTPFKQADIRFNNGVELVANTAGNISINANVTVGNIVATNLGNIATINLDGSNANVLYGNGVFAPASGGNGTYGDSNVVSLLSAFGSNTITTTGNVSVGNIIGNGQALTGIAGANVSGFVPNANVANTAFAVAGANVSGFVPNANVANTAFAVAAANVSGLGNIATVNLDGNVSNLLTGNGTYVAIPVVPTVGNIATLNLDGSNTNVLYGNGVFAAVAGGGNYNDSNVASFLAAFGSNTITTTGNVTVGNLILNGTPVQAIGTITPVTGNVVLGANVTLTGTTSANATTIMSVALPSAGTWQIASIVRGEQGTSGGGGSSDPSMLISYGLFNASGTLVSNSEILINNGVGTTNQNTGTGQTVIVTTGAETYTIRAWCNDLSLSQDPQIVSTSAGRSYATFVKLDPAATISTTANVTFGNVIADNLGNISPINIDGSNSNVLYGNGVFAAVAGGNANTGNVTFNDINIIGTGNLKLQPDSTNANAYLDIYLTGGPDIHIAGNGETVILGTDDFANVAVNVDGNVSIQAGDANGTQTWNFDTAGNLTLPRGGIVYETNIPDGGLNGNTIALKPSGGTNADQQLLIYPTTDDANHLHLTSGNLYSTELFLGDDNLYVKLANTGNVVINSNDGTGNTAQWTLDTTGNLTLPDTTSVLANVNITLEANDTGNITGLNLIGDSNANLYAHGNVTIVSDSSNTTATWAFGNNGILTLPGGSQISETANVSTNINVNGNAWAFGVNGNLTLPGNIVTPNGANAQVGNYAGTAGAPLIISAGIGGTAATSLNAGAGGNLTIKAGDAGSNIGNQSWGEAGGELVLRGGNSTGPYIGGDVAIYSGGSPTTPGAISLYTGANQWTFDATGNLTVPGSLINDTSIVLAAPAVFNICTIATAGSGYNTGSSLKATTGGSGTGMTVGIGYGLSNQLTSVSVVNPGTGYVNGDVITVSEGTGGTFVISKYNQSANQTNNNTIQTDFTFANSTVTLPIYGEMATDASMTLTTNLANAGNTSSWIFGDDGKLTFPGTPRIDTSTNNFEVQAAEAINFEANTVVNIYTDAGNNAYQWQFGDDGNLTLPGNTFAVNYANGTQVSIGGSGNTGNVTFSDQVVMGTGGNDGTGGLYLAPGNASIANSAVQYLRVRGGDVATHIHLDTGNNAFYDQYFGADSRYVKLEANGNIVINADDYNGNAGTWTFDTTGNLTLPGNLVIAGNTSVFGTNAALIQTTDNRPLLALSSGANGAVSSLWVEDIGNVGTSNIAAVYANPTVGSGIVRIAVGQNGGGGPNLWDFGATGNLTLPGNTVAINFANGSSAFGNIVATNLDGNVSNLLTGNGTYVAIPTVPSVGNIATINLDGNSQTWLAGNGVFANIAIPSVGNIATLNLDGNVSNVLRGDGTFGADANSSYGDSNVTSLLGAFGSNTISTTGNISAGNISAAGNITGNYFIGNGSQLTDLVQGLVKPNNLLYVAKNGNDTTGTGSINAPYQNIQTAINAAAGDTATTIILAPGNYVGDLSIGNVANSLNITGSGLAESAINGNIVISGTSDNIEFDNLRIATGRITHNATGYWSVINSRFSANTGITKTSSSTIKIFNTDLGAAGTGNVLLQGGKTNIYSSQVFNVQVSGANTEVNFLQCDTVILPTVISGNVNFIDTNIVSSGTGNSLNAVGGYVTLKNCLSITPSRTLAPIGFGAGTSYSYGDSGFDVGNSTFAGTANIQLGQFQAINVRGGNITTNGLVSATGNITGGNINTGVVTLTNGAVIKDTAGDSVSFGQNAGNASQGSQAVAIGLNAGANGQANGAVALGVSAGQLNQGITGIAIGDSAGSSNQGLGAVAIGAAAGFDSQGQYSVAMGYYAGYTSQANNSIILNATGANLNQTTANTFTVSPVRNDTSNIAEVMFYNATSKEVTYGNTISVAGNISGGNISATGNITGSYLISTHASANEGGEISLAQPPNGNLSGGITIDAYQNTLRMFEQGGTARGLSIDIANSPAGGGTAIGYRDIPQVAAGNVTLGATDAGKHYYSTTAGNLTLTIPLNSSVPFTTGAAISIVVQAAGNILVNAASGVTLYMAGNSTAANRVVGGYGMATLMKVATDTWFINGTGVA